MSRKKESSEEGWDRWIYKPAPIITITIQQKRAIVDWLQNQKEAEQKKAEDEPRVNTFGERREIWLLDGEPFFIHTDPIPHKPMRFKIQVACKPEHAEELLAAGIIKKIPEYK